MEQPIIVKHDGVPLHWHEAVTVVRSVADALLEGRIRAVPPAGELALERDGSLHVSPGAVGRAAEPAQLTAALRELLRDRLPPDAPAGLSAVADGGAAAPGSLAEMRDAVRFFERPSSARDREALAGRLEKIQEERHLEDEIERLKRKARTAEASLPDAGHRPVRSVAKKSRTKVALVAAAGVAAGLVAAAFFAPGTARKAWTASASIAADAARSGFVRKLHDATRSAANTPQAAPPESVQAKAAPRPQRTPIRRSIGSTRSSPSSANRAVDVLPRASRLELTRLSVLPFSVSAPLQAWKLPENFARIFTGDDLEAAPPVLLRPHLPTVPSLPVPREQLGSVLVLVAEDGSVEQVRLVSTTPERAYYDAMILAAVKAWVFRPATRGGQPVRYRLAIRLT